MSKITVILEQLQEIIAALHALGYDMNELSAGNAEFSTYASDIDDRIVPVLMKYKRALDELLLKEDPLSENVEGDK